MPPLIRAGQKPSPQPRGSDEEDGRYRSDDRDDTTARAARAAPAMRREVVPHSRWEIPVEMPPTYPAAHLRRIRPERHDSMGSGICGGVRMIDRPGGSGAPSGPLLTEGANQPIPPLTRNG